MIRISALINTFNEAENIKDCLENLRWVDEIIVVDMESTDGTTDIARQFTDKVFIVPPGNFSELRNTGLKKVSGDWVLQIDADERVSTALAEEIQSKLSSEPLEDGFYIPFHNYFLGKWIKHCDWYPDNHLRLFRYTPNTLFSGLVHERLNLSGTVGLLKHHIDHFSYTSLEQYINKSNHYTTLAAEERNRNGRKTKLIHVICRPIKHFLRIYLVKGGFLDGSHGLILSYLQSVYVFLRTAKAWLGYREQQSREKARS